MHDIVHSTLIILTGNFLNRIGNASKALFFNALHSLVVLFSIFLYLLHRKSGLHYTIFGFIDKGVGLSFIVCFRKQMSKFLFSTFIYIDFESCEIEKKNKKKNKNLFINSLIN